MPLVYLLNLNRLGVMARIHRNFCIIVALCFIIALINLMITIPIRQFPSKVFLTNGNNNAQHDESNTNKKEKFQSFTLKGRNENVSKSESPTAEVFQELSTDWQTLSDSDNKYHVYSAYYDHISDRIMVIGASWVDSTDVIQCRFYNEMKMPIGNVNGTIQMIHESWDKIYSACFIICNPPKSATTFKSRYVSLKVLESRKATFLRIQYPSEKSNHVEFAACVKPIHGNYNNVMDFIEWMEFHKLMGVERFTFFNFSIGADVSCVLEQYGSQVEVLPWTLPFDPLTDIRDYGESVTLNDCVYRYRGSAKYLALIDLDEMIVPRNASNYSVLIQQLDSFVEGPYPLPAAYSFQNAFFFMHWSNDKTPVHIKGNRLARRVANYLKITTKTKRTQEIYQHETRSKYICVPDMVIEAGTHFLWDTASGYSTLWSTPDYGFLHHYRQCDSDICDDCPYVNTSTVDNFAAENFGKILAVRVAHVLQSIKDACKLDLKKILPDSRSTCDSDI